MQADDRAAVHFADSLIPFRRERYSLSPREWYRTFPEGPWGLPSHVPDDNWVIRPEDHGTR